MTPALQKYYEARLEMMGGQGWSDLIEDIQRMIDSTDTLSGVDDLQKLHFRKGEINIMNWLKSLKEISNAAYEDLKNADNE